MPSTLFQARHQKLGQAVAAGSLIRAGMAQHGAHVSEGQLLNWICCPCKHLLSNANKDQVVPACEDTSWIGSGCAHANTVKAMQWQHYPI